MSTQKKDILLLIVRLIIGGVFILAGWMKVSAMAQTIVSFGTMGIPAFLAYLVSYAELIGGVLLVLGIYSCIASAVLSIIMIVAVYFTYPGGMQMFGTPLATLAALLGLLASGAGNYVVPLKKSDTAN